MATEQDELEKYLKTLGTRLDNLAPVYLKYQRYYDGDQPTAFAVNELREMFGKMLINFADNFCPVVVDAVTERATVDGFRFGRDEETGQLNPADDVAWAIWQANQLDSESRLAHRESLIKGEASVLVWPGDDFPVITIEDPSQMTVLRAVDDRRRREAALKRWKDDDGFVRANLYLPDGLYKFRSKAKFNPDSPKIEWDRYEVDDESWPLDNPFQVVPVVPMVNRMRLDGSGTSELREVLPRQDWLNKLAQDILVASDFAAYRQRVIMGIEIPEDPLNPGAPDPKWLERWRGGVDRLWFLEDEGASVHEFSAADLEPHVKAIEMMLFHLASATRTPPHYFMAGMGQFPSGESLKSSESGLVSKVRERLGFWGETWEEVMRLALYAKDPQDPRARNNAAETIWHDPETRTEGERTDAALKRMQIGIPKDKILEYLGYTPEERKEMRKMELTDAAMVATAFDPIQPAPDAT